MADLLPCSLLLLVILTLFLQLPRHYFDYVSGFFKMSQVYYGVTTKPI